MKDKIKSYKGYKIKGFIGFILLVLLLSGSVALLFLKIQEAREISAENQGYVRYLACLADIRNELDVIAVSNDISDACWSQAEKEAGVTLSRYSEKVLLDNFER